MNDQALQTETAAATAPLRPLEEILNEQLESKLSEIYAIADASQAVSLHTLSDDDVFKRADEAYPLRDEAAELATIAGGRAKTAAALFARTPNSENLVARDVEAQRAANARAEATEIDGMFQPLFAEARRRAEVAELAALRGQLDVGARLAPIAQRIADALERCTNEVNAGLREIAAELGAHNDRLPRLNDLEKRYGDGAKCGPMNVSNASELIAKHLLARFEPRDAPLGGITGSKLGSAKVEIVNRMGRFAEIVIRSAAAMKPFEINRLF